MGVVQDEVFRVDKFALKPQRGRRVGEVGAFDKTVADRAFVHALVEAGQKVFGAGERPNNVFRGRSSMSQAIDSVVSDSRNGSYIAFNFRHSRYSTGQN